MSLFEDTLRFTVLGRPQGKGSKRAMPLKTGKVVLVDSNRNARPWATCVSAAASEHHRGPLLRCAVGVELLFCFARPKSHFGTGRFALTVRAGAPREMTTMPDVDKLARCALDALTGIVIVDDAQIAELTAAKRYDEPERLEVAIREL